MSTSPTITDRYDLPVSTRSTAAVEHYVEGLDRILSLNADADVALEQAIKADDGFALAHAALAFLRQFQGRGQEAREAAEQATARVAGAAEREQSHVAVITAAVNGDLTRARALVSEHLNIYPRDALLLYQTNNLISAGGGANREQERHAIHERLAPAYGDDWWFLSSHSFALHELQQFEASRRLSEQSLAINPRNASASHNIAHIYYETVDHAPGVAFLAGWLTGYDQRAPFHCHLSWHLALFELASGHYQRALELYERHINPAVAQARIALLDGAALLWRFQLYGCADAPLPWQPVAELGDRIAARPGFAFGDVHAALAYAAVGDHAGLDRLSIGWQALASKGHPIAGSVVLPLIHGVAAFAAGDYAGAINQIEPVADQIHQIGGSHAQWELWEETLVEAYLRTGRFDQAEQTLRRRLDRRASARDYFWLARAQDGRGDGATAAASARAARQQWRTAELDAPEQVALARLVGGHDA